jgi:hypothetical protein
MALRYELDNRGGVVATNKHGLSFYLTGLHGQPPPNDPEVASAGGPRYTVAHAYDHGRRG